MPKITSTALLFSQRCIAIKRAESFLQDGCDLRNEGRNKDSHSTILILDSTYGTVGMLAQPMYAPQRP